MANSASLAASSDLTSSKLPQHFPQWVCLLRGLQVPHSRQTCPGSFTGGQGSIGGL